MNCRSNISEIADYRQNLLLFDGVYPPSKADIELVNPKIWQTNPEASNSVQSDASGFVVIASGSAEFTSVGADDCSGEGLNTTVQRVDVSAVRAEISGIGDKASDRRVAITGCEPEPSAGAADTSVGADEQSVSRNGVSVGEAMPSVVQFTVSVHRVEPSGTQFTASGICNAKYINKLWIDWLSAINSRVGIGADSRILNSEERSCVWIY